MQEKQLESKIIESVENFVQNNGQETEDIKSGIFSKKAWNTLMYLIIFLMFSPLIAGAIGLFYLIICSSRCF